MQNLISEIKLARIAMYRDWVFWVVLGLVFIMMFAALRAEAQSGMYYQSETDRVSANDPNTWPRTDGWGNVYPMACRQNLSFLQPPIEYEPLGLTPSGLQRMGYTDHRLWRDGTIRVLRIVINSKITDDKIRERVLHHERCHVMMWLTTGDPNWHDPKP